MSPDEILADLAACRPGLTLLAQARGDAADLRAALHPDTPTGEARAAARALVRKPPGDQLDVDGAEGERRTQVLAAAVALAALMEHVEGARAWRDALEDLHHDLLARPQAYRDLSAWALTLSEVAELPDKGLAPVMLMLAARAALDAPSTELLDRTRDIVARGRRASRAQRWAAWLQGVADAATAPLRDALGLLETGAVPMAASDGTPAALARVALGEALGGEVSLAVTHTGLVVEWEGDGAPPDAVHLDGHALPEAPHATLATRTWAVQATPAHTLELVFAGPSGEAAVQWQPSA